MNRAGLTLVELLMTILIMVGGGGAILFSMRAASIHTELLKQNQIAMNAAQGRLDQLASEDFAVLAKDGRYRDARVSSQQETFPALPDGVMALQIRQPASDQARHAAGSDPSVLGSAELLDLHVAVCWTHRSRVIGETGCTDGPDNGFWVNSPVMVSTRMGIRS